ncbi:helix-turn-helix domain-containing protein [Sporomusa malonica]|uniref:DNA-binding transcriptional regulator, XRE-family HTH domain n=1 Tax=Sporomusa malonica TaxID=112901 RepID=A0A1W1ZRK9_9FIRM|nr:helix-turn-helix domain-containing protein [Sporomusa malonica]SMC51034.1 DNA-binding transcriptional regulator, XRE-family HTH domain [Sporomusa malonica]
MESLGEKIKLLRNKLTQEELAAILKVERSTLASWEVNRREPDIATLCRIAAYFQISIDWLVGHTFDKEASSSRTAKFHETTGDYHAPLDSSWLKVIETAQSNGFKPDAVQQLIELNAKIALSLKDNKSK